MPPNSTPPMDPIQAARVPRTDITLPAWSASFSVRQEILRITHLWPQILLFCIAGCLAGWVVSQLWPVSYQASIDLYVGLSIDEIPSDQPASDFAGRPFKEVVDYKNWQMMNLNGFIFMDRVLDDALSRLRAQDPYWNQVSPAQLSDLLGAYWRSAGKWRLTARHPVALYAFQAVFAWQSSILDHTQQAIQASRSLHALLAQRQANATHHTQLITTQASYLQVQSAVQEQLTKIGLFAPAQPLNELDRWLVWQTIVQANLGPDWLPLAEAFPPSAAPSSSYISWLEKAAQALERQLQVIQEQITSLEIKMSQLDSEYSQALTQSMGLSAYLEIQAIQNPTSQELQLYSQELANCKRCSVPSLSSARFLSTLQPTGVLPLIGGLLGLIGWLLYRVIRLTNTPHVEMQS